MAISRAGGAERIITTPTSAANAAEKQIPISISNYVAAMIVAVIGLAFANISNGQVYVDDFNDLDDDGWDRYDPLSGGDFAFPDGTYQISTTAPDNAFFGPARVGTTLSGVSMTDFQVSVDLLTWDETLPQTFGIIARAENIGLGTSTGYMFSFSPGESAGRSFTALAIDRLDNEQAASGGAKYNLPGGDLTPGEGYRMVFVGIGGQFSGSIYALSDLNTALGSVAFTDDTYQSGAFGLLVTDSNISDLQGATATFDNFSLTAVPEPALAALAMGVFGALVSVVRRRGRVDGPLPPSLSRHQPQEEDHENGRGRR